MSLRAKITSGLLASSAAMTLMACYGAPCGPDECGFDGTGGPEESCDAGGNPEVIADSQVPQTVDGTLVAQPGANRGTCGGDGDEIVYQWTPPAAGAYRMSVSSNADTVLYVRAPDADGGDCGQELACNDDTQGTDPEVTVNLTTTDPVLIVVDSISSGDAGNFTLSIDPI